MNWEEKFLKGIFSEPDGKPSFTRCTAAVVTTTSLVWISIIINHNIRLGITPILPEFGGLIGFVSIFYGINQCKNAIGNFFNKGSGNGS